MTKWEIVEHGRQTTTIPKDGLPSPVPTSITTSVGIANWLCLLLLGQNYSCGYHCWWCPGPCVASSSAATVSTLDRWNNGEGFQLHVPYQKCMQKWKYFYVFSKLSSTCHLNYSNHTLWFHRWRQKGVSTSVIWPLLTLLNVPSEIIFPNLASWWIYQF